MKGNIAVDTTQRSRAPRPPGRSPLMRGIGPLILLGGVGLFLAFAKLVVDGLWFQEVGYLPIFWIQRGSQACLWAIAIAVTLVSMGGNFWLAHRLAQARQAAPYPSVQTPAFSPGYLALARLILSVTGIILAICVIVIHYTAEGLPYWSPNLETQTHSLQQLSLNSLGRAFQLVHSQPWVGLGVAGAFGLFLTVPLLALGGVTLCMALGFGLILSHQWAVILAAFNVSAFADTDPLFHLDIGFYVFQLPLWELFQFLIVGMGLLTFLGVTLYYLLAGDSLRQGRMPRFTNQMQRHLYALASLLMFSIALSWGLHCFTLLYSREGALYGAGFTDTNVHLPVRIALGTGAILIAIFCLYRALVWSNLPRRVRLYPLLSGYGGIALVLAVVLPALVQNTVVLPNELAREQPYLVHSIQATRHAFGLDTIRVETFDPSGSLTAQRLQENALTVRNIRLWDAPPLLEANRQLQRIRPYYEFADADIDRYTLPTENTQETPVPAAPFEKRQVLIAARELDFNAVPEVAQTWVNQRLVYTHGFGFTVSPVNRAAPSGLPEYFVQDISADSDSVDQTFSAIDIRNSIPTQSPRIYFGEMTHNYVLTDTRQLELDYPSGDENAYTRYAGTGGIPIGAYWRRILFATTLRDWQMLLTPNITGDSRILMNRLIQDRVRLIAPFLRFDNDPYLVTAAVKEDRTGQVENVLYWIIDAYTLSDRYPYSDPGSQNFNYIRNSVKVVVDAYSGAVRFYNIEPDEPILQTWSKVFPGLIEPIEAMPVELRGHLRYPIDLFQAQSQALLAYHMTDPQVFYNREDQWRFPTEIYGNEPAEVRPYYLITKLPEGQSEEFILLIPFTPAARNNLIAWMAARSDGQNYGKRLLYQFPKRELVFGPEQVEALINQDPVISQQISLWNRQGSRVRQGNLLIIPIERSLLYVEPLYLEAEKTSVPTLARVITLYKDRIVMAESLEKALGELFSQGPLTEAESAIVRPVGNGEVVPPSPEAAPAPQGGD
ncbi:UPF0182 family protein [Lyngbya confervoides]|uniref:UPF0182 protein QQ91_0002840 n=1 Tax=Lyngbya confervoides BDU141951 TaxID=1574623 RepID=A0ABD4SZN1_9CYAN|nr:UPF0182 family protein [Lyngbya confervoides]MCM1981769.1 UPF0182 family protein [Lyngbya confervoides BDU141951]